MEAFNITLFTKYTQEQVETGIFGKKSYSIISAGLENTKGTNSWAGWGGAVYLGSLGKEGMKEPVRL